MAFYRTNNRSSASALTSAYKTFVSLIAAGAGRIRLWELTYALEGTLNATDCQVIFDIASWNGFTAGLGNSAAIISKIDPSDRITGTQAFVGYTGEPTVLTSLRTLSLNQRFSQAWRASGPDKTIVSPDGLCIRALSPTSTAALTVGVLWEEMST